MCVCVCVYVRVWEGGDNCISVNRTALHDRCNVRAHDTARVECERARQHGNVRVCDVYMCMFVWVYVVVHASLMHCRMSKCA